MLPVVLINSVSWTFTVRWNHSNALTFLFIMLLQYCFHLLVSGSTHPASWYNTALRLWSVVFWLFCHICLLLSVMRSPLHLHDASSHSCSGGVVCFLVTRLKGLNIIHPSIHPLSANPLSLYVVAGVFCGASPSCLWVRAGCSLDESPAHHRPHWWQRPPGKVPTAHQEQGGVQYLAQGHLGVGGLWGFCCSLRASPSCFLCVWDGPVCVDSPQDKSYVHGIKLQWSVKTWLSHTAEWMQPPAHSRIWEGTYCAVCSWTMVLVGWLVSVS